MIDGRFMLAELEHAPKIGVLGGVWNGTASRRRRNCKALALLPAVAIELAPALTDESRRD
jgi:hypothetical protein